MKRPLRGLPVVALDSCAKEVLTMPAQKKSRRGWNFNRGAPSYAIRWSVPCKRHINSYSVEKKSYVHVIATSVVTPSAAGFHSPLPHETSGISDYIG